MAKVITSPQNQLVKDIVGITEKVRERRASGFFVAEGLREVNLALRNGWEVETILYNPILTDLQGMPLHHVRDLIEVSPPVMEKIAYRANIPNVVAIIKQRELALPTLQNTPAPLVLILEQVEKPGNLGAMLRTADAAAVSAVIICDPATDVWNPNTVRNSLGALFTVPIALGTTAEVIEWAANQGIRTYATHLEASTPYTNHDFNKPTAFVLGAEATGLTPAWWQHADERIIVPMSGSVDSMNVSVTAGIVLFEALRQRQKQK